MMMALYNGGYPATYQNPYLPQPVQPQYQPVQNSGIIWIQGEAAAKSYLVAPNTSVALWDSEAQTVYIKSADASGMPSIKVLDYTIRDNGVSGASGAISQPINKPIEYATKSEIKALSERISAIQARLDKTSGKGDEVMDE